MNIFTSHDIDNLRKSIQNANYKCDLMYLMEKQNKNLKQREKKKITICICICVIFMIVELVGGLLAGSIH